MTTKAPYTTEAIDEASEFIYSKTNFIDLGCSNIRVADGDAIQAMYSLTKILPDTQLINPEF